MNLAAMGCVVWVEQGVVNACCGGEMLFAVLDAVDMLDDVFKVDRWSILQGYEIAIECRLT